LNDDPAPARAALRQQKRQAIGAHQSAAQTVLQEVHAAADDSSDVSYTGRKSVKIDRAKPNSVHLREIDCCA
jgi:hypothetical protein